MECCCIPKQLKLCIKTPGKYCGGCVNLQSTLYDTISSQQNCECMQIFLGNPTTYECKKITKEDKKVTFDYCLLHNKTFYVHAPFIANLSKPDSKKSVNLIAKELDIIDGLPASCVVHIGKGPGASIENVAQNINQLKTAGHLNSSHHSRVPFHLLLENAAGQGSELGTNKEELRHLFEGLDSTCVGLCIDTQHTYASGMCDFSSAESTVKLFDALDGVTTKGISMIHLNDSTKEFGAHVDRHAPLGEGFIWGRKENMPGLKELIRISKCYGLDLISETSDPFGDKDIVESIWNELEAQK